MASYHILIVIISSVIPENLVLLTKSEQSGPKSAHIRPTIIEDICYTCRSNGKRSLWRLKAYSSPSEEMFLLPPRKPI